MRAIDITGQKFGRLTAVSRTGQSTTGGRLWLFGCECGGTATATMYDAKRGHTKSCGCLNIEVAAARLTDLSESRLEANTKHGNATSRKVTPEYRTWCAMKARCGNPKNKEFRNYGGRGVTVCERWIGDFAAFLADMGERPSPTHSIDRIDPYGNYEPSNCRWATPKQQRANQRRA